jgi:hypothetical protein
VYKNWEDEAAKSQNKKLLPMTRLWLSVVPRKMGRLFGRVRAIPKNILSSSPYLSKWTTIKKKVSDYKAAQVDGREEELPDIEGPTGAGVDENGDDDERMVEAADAMRARDVKRNERYVPGVDKESLLIIEHFIKLFPQSVSGVGIQSESDSTSGAGRKREFCEIDGLNDTAAEQDGFGAPAAKKVSKSSLIIDLSRSAVLHHQENMAFSKSHFEYQKETRLQDISRRDVKDNREIEYRERQDEINQERYLTEQTRLAETRQDNKEMQSTFADILTNLLGKLQ